MLILIPAPLAIILQGCKKEPCEGCISGGSTSTDKIRCYSDYFHECKFHVPFINEPFSRLRCPEGKDVPCDCKDVYGNSIASDFCNCNTALQGNNCKGSTTPYSTDFNVDETYKLNNACSVPGNDVVCTEYSTYYLSLDAYNKDYEYRPIFVNFSIANFDLFEFYYVIHLTNDALTKEYYKAELNSFSLNMFTSYMEPESCDGICDVTGTVKMDISSIKSAGNYLIYMSRISNIDGTESNFGSSASFTVSTTDFDGISLHNYRFLYFYESNTGNTTDLNLFNVSIGSRTYAQALEFVFGIGKCNIKFNSEGYLIEENYINNDNNAMITVSEAGLLLDAQTGLKNWMRRVYQEKYYGSTNALSKPYLNKGISAWINYVALYENNFTISTSSLNLTSIANLNGVKFPRTQTANDYFNGTVVIRKNCETLYNALLSAGTPPSVDEISLTVFLHEMGHMWSTNGMSNTGTECNQHIEKCNGKNSIYCLFHLCYYTGVNPLYSFVTSAVAEPVFCEGHQQIFMNQLRSK